MTTTYEIGKTYYVLTLDQATEDGQMYNAADATVIFNADGTVSYSDNVNGDDTLTAEQVKDWTLVESL